MSDNNPPFKKTILSTAIPSQTELIAIGQEKAEKEAGVTRAKSPFGKTGELNHNCTPAERGLAMLIAQRGAEYMKAYKVNEDVLTACIDIVTVHLNDRPLRLLDFVQGDVTAFAHDYSRIRRLLNRTTGRLPSDVVLCFEAARH